MHTSELTNELDAALALAQAQIKPALKDSINPHFKSKYADLASIVESAREPLGKNGLNVTQTLHTDFENQAIGCSVRIGHKSGQWLGTSILWAKLQRGLNPQDVGSAATYLRRYTYAAALGVVADLDDDGESLSDRGQKLRKAQPQPSDIKAKAEQILAEFKKLGVSQYQFEELVGRPIDLFAEDDIVTARDLYRKKLLELGTDKSAEIRQKFKD